jgi:peptidoglycan/xylan/chitin deacetylase (PgdA/CDA1 family)
MNKANQKLLGLFVKTNGVLSQKLFGGIGHIFMLHRVLPEKLRNQYAFNRSLAITPDFLELSILYLKQNNYQFVSLDTLCETIKSGKKPKNKFICITLDDGYKDNLDYGFPVFEKHKVPFTIYVTNCFPNNTANLYWYWLEEKIMQNDKLVFEDISFILNSDKDKELAYQKIRGIIKNADHNKRIEFTNNFFKKDSHSIAEELMKIALSWDELKQLNSTPLANIGAHTMNHFSLAHLNKDEMEKEIIQASDEMEIKLGKKPEHFAYPYGGMADAGVREYQAAANYGFKTATINYPGNVFMDHKNFAMSLPRYPLSDNTTKENLEYYLNGIRHFSANEFHKLIKY